jgi:hypothetical protein
MGIDIDNLGKMNDAETVGFYYIMQFIASFLLGIVVVGMFYWASKPYHIALYGIILAIIFFIFKHSQKKYFEYWKRHIVKKQ